MAHNTHYIIYNTQYTTVQFATHKAQYKRNLIAPLGLIAAWADVDPAPKLALAGSPREAPEPDPMGGVGPGAERTGGESPKTAASAHLQRKLFAERNLQNHLHTNPF